MKLEYFILGLLTLNPSTGYDIKKSLDTDWRFARKRAPLSQIYTTLKRMVEQGWVYFEEDARDGKPNAKVYHNTEEGEKVFIEYLHSPIEPPFRFRESDIMYRMMFASLIGPEVILKHLHTEMDFRKRQIAEFRPRDRTMHSPGLSPDQLKLTQEIAEKLHQIGARSMDDFVSSLEEMIDFFESHQAN
jgi:DNA-binding PadR family transcriptional regulator